MMIDWSLALWAGAVGGVAMTVMMTLSRMMGMVDAEMALYQGCMITKKDHGAATWIAGFLMHLMIAALIALAYAWAFQAIWGRSTWLLGLVNAVVHWLIAGMALPMMDGMNPCVKDARIKGFGLYAKNYGGMMVVGFLMAHLLYGAIVGWIYTVPGS
jgi:hypothetical protein